MAQRSALWQFFNKINKKEAICELCNKILQTGGNTSNIRKHLRTHQNNREVYKFLTERNIDAKPISKVSVKKSPSVDSKTPPKSKIIENISEDTNEDQTYNEQTCKLTLENPQTLAEITENNVDNESGVDPLSAQMSVAEDFYDKQTDNIYNKKSLSYTNDHCEMFMLSIVPHMQSMTQREQLSFQQEILKLIETIKYPTTSK